MLDTNVVLDIFYQRKSAMEKLKDFTDCNFIISHLVAMEFMCGMQVRQKKDGRKFLSFFTIKPYDSKAHIESSKFSETYFTGRENKPMDLMIAAHAKSLNLPIITNNAKDFIFKEVKVYHYEKSFWL